MKLLPHRIQTLVTLCALPVFTLGAFAQAKHVVVVGVDGLSPDGILHADVPNLKRLREQGACTFHWTGTGTLLVSSSVNGPWTPALSQANPQTVPTSGASSFWRIGPP